MKDFDDNNVLTVLKRVENSLDGMKFDRGERQYIAAPGALEAKEIIQKSANQHRNPKVERLQLGKYYDSSVAGHLGDDKNVSLMNLHGQGGWQYQVGYLNRTAKVIARFLNDGTVKYTGTMFFDLAIEEAQNSQVVQMKQRERALELMKKKKGDFD